MENRYMLVGARREYYSDTRVSGHNCNFNYEQANDFIRWNIFFKELGSNQLYKVELTRSEGECSSGWCTASWGHIVVSQVDSTGPLTHTPKKHIIIDDLESNNGSDEDVCNMVYSCSYDGGDGWYPSGSYYVNEDLFIESKRAMSKAPCWIFYGQNGAGKSTIAESFGTNKTVFETDSLDVLPDTLDYDVIVLGGRSHFTLDDIRSRIPNSREVILVKFTKDSTSESTQASIDLDKYSIIEENGVQYMAIKAKYFRSLKSTAESVEYLASIFKITEKEKQGFLRLPLSSLREVAFTLKDRFERYTA